MNLPIDVVVELLMANCQEYGEYGHESDMCVDLPCGTKISDTTSKRLRTKVREYLLTLVPKPMLLSECEEFKTVDVFRSIKAHRERGDAFSDDDRWIGNASDFQVIQPVEVQ